MMVSCRAPSPITDESAKALKRQIEEALRQLGGRLPRGVFGVDAGALREAEASLPDGDVHATQ